MKLEGHNTRWLTVDFHSAVGVAAADQPTAEGESVAFCPELPQTSDCPAVIVSDSKRGDEIWVGEIVVGLSDAVVPGWPQPELSTLIPCHAFQDWFQTGLLKHHLDLRNGG